MKASTISDWNIQDHLKTPEARQAYLQAALEEHPDDQLFIQSVLDDIAEAEQSQQ